MRRFLLALALPLVSASFAGHAGAQSKLYAGPQGDGLYEKNGPRLMAALLPEYRLGLYSSSGGRQTLEKVLQDSEAIGFLQKDVLRDHLARKPEDAGKVQMFGNLGLRCLYGVVRKGGWVTSFEDLLRQREEQPIRVDIGEPEGDTAASFAAMRAIEPNLARVVPEHRGGLRALYMVEAGLTDVALFVEEPRLDSPAVAKVMETDALKLIPVVSRALLAPDEQGEGSYVFTRVVVERNTWVRRETSYETLCTPVGIVVNTAGDPPFLDAVAYASISGKIAPSDPSLTDRLLYKVESARRSVMQLLARF